MRITEADWARDTDSLQHIRRKVFIEEQSVPLELEWDGEDDNALHWLASDDNGEAVGTVRMLRNGHIGRMAVLPAFRNNGYGTKLLEAVIQKATDLDLRELNLHAQTHAVDFYQRHQFVSHGPEFMDAGMPHIAMRRVLREERRLGQDGGKHGVTSPAQAAHSLGSQCRHSLRLLSTALEPDFFETDEFVDAVSALARLQRHSEIRLLITDTDKLDSGHRLLRLQQRLNSSIKLRALGDEHSISVDRNFLVADNCGVLVINRNEPSDCWADFNCKPLASEFAARFDEYWNIAEEDPNFRQMLI